MFGSRAYDYQAKTPFKQGTFEIRYDESSFSHLRNTELNPFNIGYEIQGDVTTRRRFDLLDQEI